MDICQPLCFFSAVCTQHAFVLKIVCYSRCSNSSILYINCEIQFLEKVQDFPFSFCPWLLLMMARTCIISDRGRHSWGSGSSSSGSQLWPSSRSHPRAHPSFCLSGMAGRRVPRSPEIASVSKVLPFCFLVGYLMGSVDMKPVQRPSLNN